MSLPDSNPSEDRTFLASDRTLLANERTYQAWIRTGLTALATGLGMARFMQDLLPHTIVLMLAVILTIFSSLAFLQAGWRYRHIHLQLKKHEVEMMPLWIALTTSVTLSLVSLLALIGLFLIV